MVSLTKPSPERLDEFLKEQNRHPYTYDDLQATATTPPRGYVVDHNHVLLGEGETVFEAACESLRTWEQFPRSWVEIWPPQAPLEAGQMIAIYARSLGFWWWNACRIVYVVDETGPLTRYGFAYGTLPDHAGSGEERFLIEWDRETNQVGYDILAFSRPLKLLFRLAYPYMRLTQKRFGRDSKAALQAAVARRISSEFRPQPLTR